MSSLVTKRCAALAMRVASSGCAASADDLVGKVFGRPDLEFDAVRAGAQKLGRPVDVGGNDRQAHGHGFEQCEAKAFVAGRQHEDIGIIKQAWTSVRLQRKRMRLETRSAAASCCRTSMVLAVVFRRAADEIAQDVEVAARADADRLDQDILALLARIEAGNVDQAQRRAELAGAVERRRRRRAGCRCAP